jgi:hypothetical protein
MRLKHMVKDKINYRALGPRTMLTRQTVQGRANDGGLRIGEMERDGVMAHGASAFLNESFMVRGDEYYMAVCNKTGGIAIYNESLNLFLSPFADGPINFNTTLDGKLNIQNISRFGRDFSVVRVPYALKLLIHELQTMNIQMRIITEDNIDQVMNMSYSDNIGKLLKTGDYKDLPNLYNKYRGKIAEQTRNKATRPRVSTSESDSSVPYADGSPAYNPMSSPEYDPSSPAYDPNASPPYNPSSPAYDPNASPPYNPNSPTYHPESPNFEPHSPEEPPPVEGIKIANQEIKKDFDNLPERDKIMLMKMAAEQRAKKNKDKEEVAVPVQVKQQTGGDSAPSSEKLTSILKIEEEKPVADLEKGSTETSSSSSSETKSVSFDTGSSGSDGVKQIIL